MKDEIQSFKDLGNAEYKAGDQLILPYLHVLVWSRVGGKLVAVELNQGCCRQLVESCRTVQQGPENWSKQCSATEVGSVTYHRLSALGWGRVHLPTRLVYKIAFTVWHLEFSWSFSREEGSCITVSLKHALKGWWAARYDDWLVHRGERASVWHLPCSDIGSAWLKLNGLTSHSM